MATHPGPEGTLGAVDAPAVDAPAGDASSGTPDVSVGASEAVIAASESTRTIGTPAANASDFAMVIAIRSPVKEPGPSATAM